MVYIIVRKFLGDFDANAITMSSLNVNRYASMNGLKTRQDTALGIFDGVPSVYIYQRAFLQEGSNLQTYERKLDISAITEFKNGLYVSQDSVVRIDSPIIASTLVVNGLGAKIAQNASVCVDGKGRFYRSVTGCK